MALRVYMALSLMLAWLPAAGQVAAEPFVELRTSEGRIVLKLHPETAPQTVANFLAYVDDGFYAGTVVHRVIPGFMVQGGGYDATLRPRPTREPIDNEAARCLKNRRGTVAMARSMALRSTTSQFFINVEDNPHLDHVRPQAGYEGYCAFATVVEGMDVADRVSRMPRGTAGTVFEDAPLQSVVINEASRIDGPQSVAEGSSAPGLASKPQASATKAAPGSTIGQRAPQRRATP